LVARTPAAARCARPDRGGDAAVSQAGLLGRVRVRLELGAGLPAGGTALLPQAGEHGALHARQRTAPAGSGRAGGHRAARAPGRGADRACPPATAVLGAPAVPGRPGPGFAAGWT